MDDSQSNVANSRAEQERRWLADETNWWPDTLPLVGEADNGVRRGDPSSPMPPVAQRRVDDLRRAGEEFVAHVESGVHAYRIGRVSEYEVAAE